MLEGRVRGVCDLGTGTVSDGGRNEPRSSAARDTRAIRAARGQRADAGTRDGGRVSGARRADGVEISGLRTGPAKAGRHQ